ncbi:MAG: DUF4236 domain-containing protein [Rhodobacteraceae bacterium]|nr:DUF4236 domain-containing protein [Paracoccaceae bacterium]
MPFRFFTRKTLFPGVTLNLSRSGPSISFCPRGLRHTIGPRGRRTTVGLPGTGLHYTTLHGKKCRTQRDNNTGGEPANPAPPPAPPPAVDPAAGQAEEDRVFLRAVVAFQGGAAPDDLRPPLENLKAGDAHWVLGMAAFQAGDWPGAISALQAALGSNDLGALCARNGVTLQIAVPITPEVTAHVEPAPQATKLVLVEALQASGDLRKALAMLKDLNAGAPEDFVIAMSLAEIAFELDDGRSMTMGWLAGILSAAVPDPDLSWALAFYTARARTRCGDHNDAIKLYTQAMAHPAVPEDMRMLAWYEKALTHDEAGDRTRYRQELSGIYAADKTFADVEDRLKRTKTIVNRRFSR